MSFLLFTVTVKCEMDWLIWCVTSCLQVYCRLLQTCLLTLFRPRLFTPSVSLCLHPLVPVNGSNKTSVSFGRSLSRPRRTKKALRAKPKTLTGFWSRLSLYNRSAFLRGRGNTHPCRHTHTQSLRGRQPLITGQSPGPWGLDPAPNPVFVLGDCICDSPLNGILSTQVFCGACKPFGSTHLLFISLANILSALASHDPLSCEAPPSRKWRRRRLKKKWYHFSFFFPLIFLLLFASFVLKPEQGHRDLYSAELEKQICELSPLEFAPKLPYLGRRAASIALEIANNRNLDLLYKSLS